MRHPRRSWIRALNLSAVIGILKNAGQILPLVRDTKPISQVQVEFCGIRNDTLCVADRRRHQRIQHLSRTEVTWKDGTGEVTVPGMIEDRSVSGLGIQIAKPIPVGSLVTVKFCNRIVEGVVRRCMKDGLGTLIGVSFEHETEQASA